MMRSIDVHALLGSRWATVLIQLGIPEAALRDKHGPCPACGGKDRFRFDNKRGRGNYICGQCGAGDGFKLLQRVFGWTFSEARKRVIEAAGLSSAPFAAGGHEWTNALPIANSLAAPSKRVLRIRRERCAIENCDDAVDYLASRNLWPLPSGCALSAHASVEYWQDGRSVGRYPAIVADVLDLASELVTCHVTWLRQGKKLADHEPRKLLGPVTGHNGCSARLMPATDVLGVAEGIETALSAAVMDNTPVWAALNTSLLARFEPPSGIQRLRVYADNDNPGLAAACRLMERLQGRVHVEILIPPAPAKDWNDVLISRNSRSGGGGPTHE